VLTLRTHGSPSPDHPTVVLLHGFGAPGDDLVALGRYTPAPPHTHWVFPAAPLELGGMYGDARAWWMIDLRDFEPGVPRRRRSHEVPDGLVEARAQVTEVLARLIDDGAGPIVLGGFSQGAMLSLDVALHLEPAHAARLAALVLMSGTSINGDAWTPRLPGLAGRPVLLSHGHDDQLLPFAAAQELRDQLRGAGAAVDWIEFDGGHEIPPPVLKRFGELLREVAPGPRP
jgi:phospholipase/carboxylesterase